ncbi:MAG: 3-ketoacyl-ACP reductase [Pseudomonadota bacterium]
MTGAALVTGGRRGIGRGIALALADAGFAVAINAEVAADDLDATVRDVEQRGVGATPVIGNVADLANHEGLLDAAEAALGPLTTLVNNAGVTVVSRGDLLDATPASFDRCMAVNARAVFFLSQAFGRRLVDRARPTDRHHCIINVTSANAHAVALNRAEYAVSKAAASMVTRCFAARLGGDDINVYEIQPGVIRTDMTAPAMDRYEAMIADGFTLTPRAGEVGDVGRVAAALAGGQFGYCTGQAVQVDGGLSVDRF